MTFTKPWARIWHAMARPRLQSWIYSDGYISHELVIQLDLLLLLQEECVDSCRSQVQFGNTMISFALFQQQLTLYGRLRGQHLGTVYVTWCVDAWNWSFPCIADLDTSIQFKLNIANTFKVWHTTDWKKGLLAMISSFPSTLIRSWPSSSMISWSLVSS